MIPIARSGVGYLGIAMANSRLPKPGRPYLQPRPGQQRVGFAEPGALAAALVGGHGRPFIDNLLRPAARFLVASLRMQKQRVVVIGLRARRNFRSLLKQRLSLFALSGLRVSMSQQACGTMEIIVRIGGDYALQIGRSRREISHLNLGDAAPVERIDRVGSRRNSFVITGTRAGKISVVEIEQAKFLIVSRRGIIQDGSLEFVNTSAPWKGLKRSTQQPGIGNYFDRNVDQRADPAQKEDDENPIRIGAAADEMHNGHCLQNESPAAEEEEK